MEEKIIKIMYDNYNLKVDSIERNKNVYKLNSNGVAYCLKIIKYEYSHFYFIISAILHIQNKGYSGTPEIIKTKDGAYYIKILDKYCYLTKWIGGRISDYSNIKDLENTSFELGEFHKYSEGFTLNDNMKPRIYWFSWIKIFNTRKNEILDFKNRINQKCIKNEFDKLYLEYLDKEVMKAEKSIKGINNSNYKEYMEREVLKRGFCHHDIANHNVLVDLYGNVNLIDFDYCILDSSLHDLGSLIIRALRKNNWDQEIGEKIFRAYNFSKQINKEDILFLKYFITFPQGFWQLGIQKYWEQQLWDEKEYLGKLERYLEEREKIENFTKEFF
ncbi:MAG: CotS family spore coat protein [Clostridiales bacterium]|nr:CotS family spore coat protein [Clostridiales bacterium]